jgi:glucose/arabinose dehydrogenase
MFIMAMALAVCARGAILKEARFGLKLPDGFVLSLAAPLDSVGEIEAMTLDAKGRIVVAGGGSVRTLMDADDDGKADRTLRVAEWTNEVSDIYFDGADLLLLNGAGIWRFADADGNGVADGPPAKWIALNESDAINALRRGPDGSWFALGKSLWRISRDGARREVLAAGFRNPSKLDFNSSGDIFTFDADVAADFFLPWYVPSRLMHLGFGQDHGAVGAWSKPDYYADVVDILAPIGRAEPRGLTGYRHTQFPEEYRDGLFFGDAAFGRVYFCRLQRFGSTYRPRVDLFLDRGADSDFAPQAISVARDGGLLVATRRAVYRIEFPAGAGRGVGVLTAMEEVLRAPQPLEAWSRAKWLPAAQQFGAEAFRRVIADATLPDAQRARALEIHAELFGALPAAALDAAALGKSAMLRARVAWTYSLPATNRASGPLFRLAIDTDAATRRVALESILTTQTNLSATAMLPLLRQNLEHPDKRIRQLAARIASRLPAAPWDLLWEADEAHSVQRELSLLLAATWRDDFVNAETLTWRALEILPQAKLRPQRTQALRALQRVLGDWNFGQTNAPYTLAREVSDEVRTNALQTLRAIFPAGDPVADLESSRLLAMLRDDAPETVEKCARALEGLVSPTADFHYLKVLAELRGAWSEAVVERVAETLANIDDRLRGPERKENWTARLAELRAALIAKEPRLAEKLAPPKAPETLPFLETPPPATLPAP